MVATEEEQTEAAKESTERRQAQPPHFIPKLKDKKVLVRLNSGGQPITGILVGYNPYEILIQTAKGQLIVFKHAIATIETVDEPKGYKA